MRNLVLKSVGSERSVEFSRSKGDYLTVVVSGDISFSRLVYLHADAIEFRNTFERIAEKSATAWSGTEQFKSLEGEFSMSVSCTSLGNVIFRFDISHVVGSEEDWQVSFGLLSELGQMQKYARDAAVLLS